MLATGAFSGTAGTAVGPVAGDSVQAPVGPFGAWDTAAGGAVTVEAPVGDTLRVPVGPVRDAAAVSTAADSGSPVAVGETEGVLISCMIKG